MSATGLDVFDKTLQTTHTWLNEIMQVTGPDKQGNEFRLTDLVGTLPVALRKQVPGRNRSGFDAESCNHCGFPPSDHIQKRPTCPPPAKSVNLNSLPWSHARPIDGNP